ncbi:MAG: TolC family protein [Thermoguttaceae bacterium]|nr:TolC family protein [Thermoguttaceae bacterium]
MHKQKPAKDATRRSVRGRYATLALLGAALVSTAGFGCTRAQYRVDADNEVYGLLNTVDKSDDEKYWELENFTLQESCASRYANLYDPDAQPSPLDDCTAAKLLADVEGPKGLQKWTKNGFTRTIENENWRSTLPAPNEKGEIVLDQKAAFDLALIHSPQYRTALENVYLAALTVTAERYAFDTKFYGGSSLFYNNYGGFKKGASSSTLNLTTLDAGANRRLATGGNIVTEIANSMVWTFSPDSQSMNPTTEISYSITQPLLRGAGRAIVLESLTRSERRLLANVRQLAFYQQGFYVGVLTGNSPVSMPSSGGYPGSGVGGASVGGFYGLLSSQIQILNQESNVASSEDNYQRYEEYFATSRITDRTDVDRMRQNWLSSQQNLIQLKDNYRDSVEEYLMSLGLPPDIENVVVRDPLLEQFVLMPETLERLQNDVSTFLAWLRSKDNQVIGTTSERYVNSIDDLRDPGTNVTRLSVADLRALFAEFDNLFAAGLQETNRDVEYLETEVRPRREAALVAMRARFEKENPELDSSFADFRLFDERVAAIRDDLDRAKEDVNEYGVVLKARGVKYDVAKTLELINQTALAYSPDDLASMILRQREDKSATPFPSTVNQLVRDLHMESDLNDPIQFNISEIEAEIKQLDLMSQNLTSENRAEYLTRRDKLEQSIATLRSGALMRGDVYRYWFSTCLTKLSEEIMTLRLVQARARLESIELAIVDVNSEDAFRVARERRLDWMNVRSNLVDQWRDIEIVADRLRSDLSVNVGGSISNEGQNPLNFSRRNARFSASVQFDAPLDRFLERNSYRQALISYDQARRNYYAYVDDVHQQIRSAVRAIELAQIRFELQRDSVLTSIKRVHSAQLNLTKPPTGSSRVGSVNTSAEALTNALESLLNSQNDVMSTWLQYQSRRMNLMLLMGVFNLDETGRWIDPGVIDTNLLRQYLSDIGASQDSLSGVDRLPTFEQLSGGRSVEAIQQMGDQDLNRENAEQGVAGEDARNRAGGGYTIPGSSNAYHVAETHEQYAEKFYEARDEETLRRRAEALELENDSTGENPGVLTLFNVDDDEETGDNLPAVAATLETVRR